MLLLRNLFTFSTAASVAQWRSIDDTVMGGLSHSQLRFNPAGHAVFEGVVSSENHGGFATVRAHLPEPLTSDTTALYMDICGDGKIYKVSVMTSDAFDGVNYETAFETDPSHCALIELPLSDFRATWHGRPVSTAPALRPEDVRQMAIMISNRQYGDFSLAIKDISAA